MKDRIEKARIEVLGLMEPKDAGVEVFFVAERLAEERLSKELYFDRLEVLEKEVAKWKAAFEDVTETAENLLILGNAGLTDVSH